MSLCFFGIDFMYLIVFNSFNGGGHMSVWLPVALAWLGKIGGVLYTAEKLVAGISGALQGPKEG